MMSRKNRRLNDCNVHAAVKTVSPNRQVIVPEYFRPIQIDRLER